MKVQIGMIGLGRMGASMVTRLLRGGHDCVVHDRAPDGIARLVALGATGAATLQQSVDLMKTPRAAATVKRVGRSQPTLHADHEQALVERDAAQWVSDALLEGSRVGSDGHAHVGAV